MNILSAKDGSRTKTDIKTVQEWVKEMERIGYSEFEYDCNNDITCKNKKGETLFFIILGQDIVPYNFGK